MHSPRMEHPSVLVADDADVARKTPAWTGSDGTILRVLLLEDVDDDAALVERALQAAGYRADIARAGTRREFEEALSTDFDVILADYSLPDYDARRALDLVNERGVEVPFIIVTGTVGEECAAEAVRLGCSDLVLKDRLSRLAPAVARALETARLRAGKREAEACLRASDRRFRAIVKNSTESVVLVDPSARILESFGPRLLGYGTEESVGWDCMSLVHPDDADRVRESFARLVAVPLSTYVVELRGRHRGGEWLWLESHGVNLLEEPEVGAVVITFRDVTARRLTLEDLQAARERLRGQTHQLESINAAMALYLSGVEWQELQRIVLVSALSLTGAGHAFTVMGDEDGVDVRLESETLSPCAAPTSDALRALYQAVVSSRRPVGCGEPGAHPGVSEACRLAAVPILAGAEVLGIFGVVGSASILGEAGQTTLGLLSKALGVIHDSHRRAKRQALMERELRQSQKMEAVGRLAGGVAHDFNNLLTAIIGFTEISLRDCERMSGVSDYLKEVLNAAERASSLTRQLLAFSRRHVVAPERLDLNAVVLNLARILHRVIGEDIELVIEGGTGLRLVEADPGQIEQVVMNLVVNARDAMPRGGHVVVETANVAVDAGQAATHPEAAAGDYVRLSVTDDGCGMEPDVLNHIFEPFFTTKEEGKGTGLGLSTVYGIVRQAGGHIRVESEPGGGTRFDLLFPAQAAHAEGSDTGATSAALHGHGETVLVVEDNDGVRNMARLILQEHGFRVLAASGAEAALEVCDVHAGPIDLLLTDVVLPRVGGREVAEAIEARRPHTPVLYMSGYTDDALVRAGVHWREVAFLQKPFTQTSLLRRVREVLDQASAGPPPSVRP